MFFVCYQDFETVKRKGFIVLFEKVYDLSKFRHPGGLAVLKPWLGRDGTVAFLSHHNVDILKLLNDDAYVGDIDKKSLDWKRDLEAGRQQVLSESKDSKKDVPPLGAFLNVADFEKYAEKVMIPSAWAYYVSGSDDERTLRENCEAFSRWLLKPRVMVDVSRVSTTCNLLGYNAQSPLYVTATALGKLADPEGEVAIVKGCAQR